MTLQETLLYAGTVLLFLAWIPSVGILRTWAQVQWRTSELGRALHAKNLALAVVLTLQMVGVTLVIFHIGRPVWFEVLRLITLGWLAAVLWRQWMVYRGILERDNTRTDPDDLAREPAVD